MDFMNDLLALLTEYWMLIAAGLGGGFLGLLFSYQTIGKVFRILGTSRSEIGALMVEEQVEIAGSADGNAVIHSPITKTPCILWQIEVQELRRSGKSSRWVTVYSDRSRESFDIYDLSGRVRVQPGTQTELWLRDDEKQTSGMFTGLDEQTISVLNELNIATKGFLNINKNMRVYERYIEKGDQIFLLGRVSLTSGTKTLDGNMPMILSDRSEIVLLGKYVSQLILSGLLGAFIGVMIYIFIVNR